LEVAPLLDHLVGDEGRDHELGQQGC